MIMANKNINSYLEMQRNAYDSRAKSWTLQNKNPVVGSYDNHNKWEDYDIYLFKEIPDTRPLIALDYGTGPGRNIIKFWNRFTRIDGTDIGEVNLENAKINLKFAGIDSNKSNLKICDGKSIPFKDESYDVVFSTICLQHIACYDIRFSILKDVFRVLKPNGWVCFQMGFGGKPPNVKVEGVANYYDNIVNATCTNGGYDVSIMDVNDVKKDLIDQIGFKLMIHDIRPTGPGDSHRNWIFIRAQK
jgi:ubiquinone/menaquinone biosynthesis C-methylase UbiE